MDIDSLDSLGRPSVASVRNSGSLRFNMGIDCRGFLLRQGLATGLDRLGADDSVRPG